MALNFSMPHTRATALACTLTALTALSTAHSVAVAAAAALPASPKTFDTTYAAPTGATLTVDAGGDLQEALDKAQPGQTIVLQAGATFTGPFTLPNKTSGSGWIYVISSKLASLPPPGQRVGPSDAANMPKITAPAYSNAVKTVANSHNFRFAGIEFAPVAGAAEVYQLITIGNGDTSPATLPQNIVFDRCYVHGSPPQNVRRGIEMDGAYVAVVDSYLTGFQEPMTDSQALAAWNTSGPLQIVDDYIEAASENVLFGGADSHQAALVPSDIEIRGNYIFKPLSLISSNYSVKNLLELKSAQRVLVTGNTLQNNPAGGQSGYAVLVTPRNQNGTAPWSVTADIAITGNTLINVGSGFDLLGQDNVHQSQPATRVLINNNVVGITGLNGAAGVAFVFLNGGSNYTIDHNTIINTALPPVFKNSSLATADTAKAKASNFVFTNNLSTPTSYGFFGAGVGTGTPALNSNFTGWTFSGNAIVGGKAGNYPAGNFFPATIAAVEFMNYSAGDYALSAGSPYKSAGSDGTPVGADLTAVPASNASVPNAPSNVVVR
jgi:hypothetical protein